MRRYESEDNHRWTGFAHRSGDIVISTRSKCGTTWMQMIVALLLFGGRLPAPLGALSPWLDHDVEPLDTVRDRLDRQTHRRFIKTHTPLDGLPLRRDVTYLVVARQPLDVAVSLFHHGHNIDRARMEELTGRTSSAPQGSFDAWLDRWIEAPADPLSRLDTLAGLAHHTADAWQRLDAVGGPHVVLVHYQDLIDDLDAEMRNIAGALDVTVDPDRWADLVGAARFDAMRDRAEELVPDRLGVIGDARAFFRRGRPGAAAEDVTADAAQRCSARLRSLVPVDVADWLERNPRTPPEAAPGPTSGGSR